MFVADADIVERHRGALGRLAHLSLAMLEGLGTASSAASDNDQYWRLCSTFCDVGRCLRMAIALDMRLARGDSFAARGLAQADDAQEADEALLEVEAFDDDDAPEREDVHEHENLYDRLPTGDPATQVAAVAAVLTRAVRTLNPPKARPIVLDRDYAALVRDLIANDPGHDPPPAPHRLQTARGPPG